jgi:uncharacterized membrane protein YraQ (UPF0718 family)
MSSECVFTGLCAVFVGCQGTMLTVQLTGIEQPFSRATSRYCRDRMQGAPASVFKQVWHLCARNVRAWKRHPVMLVGEAVQYIFFGLFIGALSVREYRDVFFHL